MDSELSAVALLASSFVSPPTCLLSLTASLKQGQAGPDCIPSAYRRYFGSFMPIREKDHYLISGFLAEKPE